MKFLRRLFKGFWNLTLCSKLFNSIKYGVIYLKDHNLISDTLYSEAFKVVLKKYLDADFDKDWIGRLYGIVNPSIKDGKFDPGSMIIEIDGDNTNNTEQIKHWVYKQMQLISDLFKINQLYDYICMDFKHVGPTQLDNYLIIIDVASRREFARYFKKFFWQTIFYGLVACGILFFIL